MFLLPFFLANDFQDLLQAIMKKEGYNASQFRQVKAFLKASWVEVPDTTSESRIMRPRFATRARVQEIDDETSHIGENQTSRTGKDETNEIGKDVTCQIGAQERGNSPFRRFNDTGRFLSDAWEWRGLHKLSLINGDWLAPESRRRRGPELTSSMTKKVEAKTRDKGKTESSVEWGDRLFDKQSQRTGGTRGTLRREVGTRAAKSPDTSAIYVSLPLPFSGLLLSFDSLIDGTRCLISHFPPNVQE